MYKNCNDFYPFFINYFSSKLYGPIDKPIEYCTMEVLFTVYCSREHLTLKQCTVSAQLLQETARVYREGNNEIHIPIVRASSEFLKRKFGYRSVKQSWQQFCSLSFSTLRGNE